MNERQAQYILAIAEHQSISKAAHSLFISQPSLSQMLINIERSCRTPLFKRIRHKMIPTYAGELYISAAREILKINNDLQLHLSQISQDQVGRITFGITTSKGQYILPYLLPQFQRQYPRFEVELIENTNVYLVEALLNRSLDLAVINYTHCDPELEYVPLPSEEMILCVPNKHPLAHDAEALRTHSIPLSRIADEPFVYLASWHGVRTMADGMFMEAGILPPKAYEVSSNTIAHSLVEQNVGITILPDNYIRFVSHKSPNVTYFSLADAPYSRKVAVCYPKNPNLPNSIQFFISCISNSLNTLMAQNKLF